MPVGPADFLLGVVLPAVLAGVLLLLARRASWGPGAGAAAAVGGGYVAAHLLQRGWRGFPPAESTDWPWVCAAGGALVAATGWTRGGATSLRVALRLVAAGGAAWVVTTSWRRGVDPSTARSATALLGAGVALVWSVLEVRQDGPGWFLPAVLALTAGGAAAAVGLSGSAKLALLAGALCAVATAAAVASALRLAPATVEGAVGPWLLGLAALVMAAALYSDLPRAAAQLVALAPCAALVPRSLLGARARGPAATALLLLLAVGALGWAVKLAVDASPSWEGL